MTLHAAVDSTATGQVFQNAHDFTVQGQAVVNTNQATYTTWKACSRSLSQLDFVCMQCDCTICMCISKDYVLQTTEISRRPDRICMRTYLNKGSCLDRTNAPLCSLHYVRNCMCIGCSQRVESGNLC